MTLSVAGIETMNQPVLSRGGVRNRLLRKLSDEDWGLIAPHLEPIALRERQVIEVPNKPITHAYFVEIGVVSVVAVNGEDHRIEVGVIGNEGFTGVTLIMGDNRAPHSAYMQIGGNGLRIPADKFVAALKQSESLTLLMMKSAQAFMIQTAHTALANGKAKLEERLARWLLMANDRLDTAAVPLTQARVADLGMIFWFYLF